jgi:hypothetical protein
MSVVIILFFYRMKTLNLLIGIILLLVVIIFMLWTPHSNSPVLVNASPGYADVNVQGVQGWNPVAYPYTRMVAPGHIGRYGGNVHRFGHVGGFGGHVRHGRR